MAGPKIEFFTPATFKGVAEHFVGMLTRETGFPWKVHGVTKSNRKVSGGATELYLEAKLYAQDPKKPVVADVFANVMYASNGHVFEYNAGVNLEYRKPVLNESSQFKTFAEVTHWLQNFKIPPHVLGEMKQASSLTERVAARYLRAV